MRDPRTYSTYVKRDGKIFLCPRGGEPVIEALTIAGRVDVSKWDVPDEEFNAALEREIKYMCEDIAMMRKAFLAANEGEKFTVPPPPEAAA